MKPACVKNENNMSRTPENGDSGFFLLTTNLNPPPRRQDAKKTLSFAPNLELRTKNSKLGIAQKAVPV
jgi:hypothetical protein